MQQINIAALGFGTVGSGVYRVLTENHDGIMHREKLDIQVRRILVRDFVNEPNLHMAPMELFTVDVQEILNDERIGVVVECMGGVEPARTYILAALKAGKTVVTSNKEVVSKHWWEFEEAAKASGAGFYIEATVGGGIPLLRTVLDSLQANEITQIMGIVNGTTNYILSKMSEEGRDFQEVLKEAQALGYAEANPVADVEGYDATYKLSILGSMAFHAHIPVDQIYREGILDVTATDFEVAKRLGCEIKLLAIGKKNGSQIEARVHPTMIRKDHPLATVNGSFNAIFITGNAVGDVMLYGRGAGQMPTASAVVGDIIYASHQKKQKYMTFENMKGMSDQIQLVTDWSCAFCMRICMKDQPGAMSKITGLFAQHDVSLRSVLQVADEDVVEAGEVCITILTQKTTEHQIQAVIKSIRDMDLVLGIESMMRIEV